MIDEKILNKSLKRKYGYQEGGQNFRIERTNTQTEFRMTESGFLELPRYNYLGPRGYWVLERLHRVSEETQKILRAEWTYEPVFIYMNPDTREPLPVTRDSIEAFVQIALYGAKKRLTPEEIKQAEEDHYEKQAGIILEYLQNEIPSMAVQLKAGSAIVVPKGLENGESNNRIVAPNAD